jgi:hypothetical protein
MNETCTCQLHKHQTAEQMQENHSAVDKTANVVLNLLSAIGVVVQIKRGFNDVTNSSWTIMK